MPEALRTTITIDRPDLHLVEETQGEIQAEEERLGMSQQDIGTEAHKRFYEATENQRLPLYLRAGSVLATCRNDVCDAYGDKGIQSVTDYAPLIRDGHMTAKIIPQITELSTEIHVQENPDAQYINPCCSSCGEDTKTVLSDEECENYILNIQEQRQQLYK